MNAGEEEAAPREAAPRDSAGRLSAACVIATVGKRPEQLARAIESATSQTEAADVVVVLDGADATVPAPARVVHLDDNVGPPGARNAGAAATAADVVFFLDDDATLGRDDVVASALRLFEADARLAVVSFRIVDPEGRPPQRRHVPRLLAGDPARSSEVTTFLEGACAIRRDAFERAGAYPAEFRFGHEGTDLAWRLLDRGYRIRYEAGLTVLHPAEPPERHADHDRLTARNRVFLVRRRLPWALAIPHLAVWFVAGLARARTPERRRALLAGFAEGRRAPCGERRPIRWRTAWRMMLLGRPPIV